MGEVREIRIVNQDGEVYPARLEISSSEPFELSLTTPGGLVLKATGVDLFGSLTTLRRQLEDRGMMLLCAGARKDVCPSGMARSMSNGRKAYVLTIGVAADPARVVDIFAESSIDVVGSVEEQRKYYAMWHEQNAKVMTPMEGEIEEAKNHPNGWIYRIAGEFNDKQSIPPDAIVGGWRVGPDGTIVGEFVRNAKYNATKWSKRKN